MELMEKNLNSVKKIFPKEIDNDSFFSILFEMNRYFDKQFVEAVHQKDIRLNQSKRNLLRKYYYYGGDNILDSIGVNSFEQYVASNNDKEKVLEAFNQRCRKYDENKIVMSIIERFKENSLDNEKENCKKWLQWHSLKTKNEFDFSLFVFDYSQEEFVKDNYNISNILKIIANIYDHLENYRHFIFKLDGKLYNKENEDVTWQILYKIGIYCENFVQYNEPFYPFKKEERIKDLTEFLNLRFKNSGNKKITKEFYSSISTGFKFEDCLISEEQQNILLVYQKIKLDKSPVPCPACLTTIQSGNSYPETFLRSYECKNQSCAQRSKSGRGKRFDEYGTYRYFKLVENKISNIISESLYSKWRKDIFSNKNDIYEMLIKYYAWDNEKICFTKRINTDCYDRKIIYYKPFPNTSYNYNFDELPICKFFNQVANLIKIKDGSKILKDDIIIRNSDSTKSIQNLKPNQIGTVMTSPPYYNAREYSQWQNLLMYLVDMMSNCKSIYKILAKDGYYLYNIGDIVNADNIYIKSNMSKKRLQLGFLSCLIFEKVGFNLVGNIIWDKGEVQSKRNLTMNRNSGYVKCINCYEHTFIFKKGHDPKSYNNVVKITPVIKINSKGENIYKHTAPYPIELVNLLKNFVIKDKYVLDPFLGSGTTLKWCKNIGLKGIGYELNETYFKLASENIGEYKKVC